MPSNYDQLFESNAVDEIEATSKSPDVTLTLGDFTLRQWGPYVHVTKGLDETGMEQISLTKLGAILGFFNGLFSVVDEADHFDVLKEGVHTYKMGKDTFHSHAGYRLVKNVQDGLELLAWETLKFEGRGYVRGEIVNPKDYSLTRGWSEDARERNRMQHNIVDKHFGIDYALRVLAGTSAVKFSLFSVRPDQRDLIAGKISLFGQSKEARELDKANAKLRGDLKKALGEVTAYASAKAEAGMPVVLKAEVAAGTVKVIDPQGEIQNWTPAQLVGKTFVAVRSNGQPTFARRTVNNLEEGAGLIDWLRKNLGVEAYLDNVLIDAE